MPFGAILGLVGAGIGAASQAGLFGGGGTLAPRNLLQEARQTIQARTQYDDQLFALNQLDAYRQAGQNNNTLANTLFGTKGGFQTINYNEQQAIAPGTHWYGPDEVPPGAQLSKDQAWTNKSQSQGNRKKYYVPPNTYISVPRTRQVDTPAARGQLDILGEAAPQFARVQAEALKAGDPNAYALRQSILTDAAGQLTAGPSGLDTARDTQNVRQAQLARGMLYGNGGAAREAVLTDRATQERRNQIQQYALAASAAGSGANYSPNNLLQSAFGIGSAGGGNFDPFNGYAADAYGTNANAAAAGNIAQRNGISAIGGSLLNLGGRYAINNRNPVGGANGAGNGSGSPYEWQPTDAGGS